MDPQLLAAILGAGGGGAVLLALVNGVFKWLSGASQREQEKNTNIAAQRTKALKDREEAEEDRDIADNKRREAEEHVAILKRQLLLLGEKPLERPHLTTGEK